MAITLGGVTFDDSQTTAEETHEEVGGRDERTVKLSGVVSGFSSLTDVEQRLDDILDVASVDDFSVALSIRADRRLLVRREGYTRQASRNPLVGTFELELKAKDPFEESVAITTTPWTLSNSGDTLQVTAAGNVYSKATISLVATGAIVNPAFSDGTRSLMYSGVVNDGETLVFDGVTKSVTLEDVDVTPYTSGEFPRLQPEGTTLTYTDDATSSHTASVSVAYRDRWW